MAHAGRIPRDLGFSSSASRVAARAKPASSARILERGLFIVLVLSIIQTGHPKIFELAYVVAIIAAITEWRNVLAILRTSTAFLAVMAISILSYFWSSLPGDTLFGNFSLIGTAATTLYGVSRFGMKGFIETFAMALGLSSVLSAVYIVALPSQGIQSDGVIRGMYSFKTQLGLGMTLALLTIACSLGFAKGTTRLVLIGEFVLSAVILSRANSVTGIISALVLTLIIPLLWWSRLRGSARIAIIGIALLSAGMVFSQSDYADSLFAVFGRDATLTGRTEIWDGVLTAIGQQPLLGFGYNAFWLDGGPGAVYVDDTWGAGAAHNGYLEVALNVGLVGEVLVAIFMIVGTVRAARLFWRSKDLASAWPICVLLNTLLTNYAEATFMYPRIDWIAIMAAYFFATTGYQRLAGSTEANTTPEPSEPASGKKGERRPRFVRPQS